MPVELVQADPQRVQKLITKDDPHPVHLAIDVIRSEQPFLIKNALPIT